MTEAANPLEAIRRVELEMARRLEDARREADEAVTVARREAARMVEEAKQRGREEARRRSRETVAAAEEEAGRIVAEGEERAAKLRAATEPDRERTITAMVEFVLAPPKERGK